MKQRLVGALVTGLGLVAGFNLIRSVFRVLAGVWSASNQSLWATLS